MVRRTVSNGGGIRGRFLLLYKIKDIVELFFLTQGGAEEPRHDYIFVTALIFLDTGSQHKLKKVLLISKLNMFLKKIKTKSGTLCRARLYREVGTKQMWERESG